MRGTVVWGGTDPPQVLTGVLGPQYSSSSLQLWISYGYGLKSITNS